MLTHLKLENFKIWRSTGPVRLAPITLLLGTNSSGKSSLIQSLPAYPTDRNEQRAKLVRAGFVQSIEEHWSRRPLEWNRVDWEKNQGILE